MEKEGFDWATAAVGFAGGVAVAVLSFVMKGYGLQRPRIRVHDAYLGADAVWCVQIVQRPLGRVVTITHLWYKGPFWERDPEKWWKRKTVDLVVPEELHLPVELEPGRMAWEWCPTKASLLETLPDRKLYRRLRARPATGWRDLRSRKRRRLRGAGMVSRRPSPSHQTVIVFGGATLDTTPPPTGLVPNPPEPPEP